MDKILPYSSPTPNMLTQSEISELASDTIAQMVQEVPELAELPDATKESLKQFFELGYVTGHADATKEAIAAFKE